MTDYATLLALVAPVFVTIGAGMFARWRGWLKPEAEETLLKLVVNLLFPCLMVKSVLGNSALLSASNVVVPPLVGFTTTAVGFLVGYYFGRALGLSRGHGLRTFAFSVGIYNYGYIPIPLVERLFGAETLGVLFVHNIGCELAIWTVGVILVAGAAWKDGWRRMINPPVIAIAGALALNRAGAAPYVPDPVMHAASALGLCAVPLGLVVIGGSLVDYVRRPRDLVAPRVLSVAAVLRLGLLPVVFLLAARYLPLSTEVRQVMIVQAAMPAGIMPLVIARLYGGQPLTAAQVILGTTALGLIVIPVWLQVGMLWVGF